MIILHSAFLGSGLLLWGETAPTRQKETSKPKDRPPEPARPRRHPFAAETVALKSALLNAGLALAPAKKLIPPPLAWLPTVDGAPLASSPLIAPPAPAQSQARIEPWSVAALPLPSGEAIELLLSCQGKKLLYPGLIVGDDLAYWGEAFLFAASLVARQRFLPGIILQDGEYRALWQPLLTGEDAERAAATTRSMPASAGALTAAGAAEPPALSPAAILGDFLAETVDHLVRSRHDRRTSRLRPASAFDSLHDQWLYALGSADGRLEGEPDELARFAAQAQEWLRPVTLTAQSPFRLCFRLEEPRGGEEAEGDPILTASAPWHLRYLLQPLEDRSLLLPAQSAWTLKGKKAEAFKRFGADPKEYLLSALGQAAGLWPSIEASLKAPAPEGCRLDASGAHEFLNEAAPVLEQAGFGVLLPAWWTGKGTRVRLSVKARVHSCGPQGETKMGLEQLLRFDWRIALGGEELSQRELEALAALKQPLVRVRGQWVEMDAAEIQAAVAFLKKKAPDELRLREIVHMALGAVEEVNGIELLAVEADGWVATLLERLQGGKSFAELIQPQGFSGTLRPYQLRGYSWLDFLRQWGLGACLADDMGLGKTVQALALIQKDWEAGARGPVLLVCPTSVVSNWQKEALRFTPELPVLVHHGLERKRGSAFKKEASRQALVISTYALLHRDLEQLKAVDWAGIILDEAQNIKNPETKQARAARGLKAGYRAALTGTPVENSVGDLWSIMEFLNPGLLGSRAEFRRSFLLPIQAGQDSTASERLKRITSPFVLRRLKTDRSIIADLPEKMEMKVFCSLTREQASLYQAVLDEMEDALAAAEGIQRKGLILATLTKLKQVCNHPAQFLGDTSSIADRSGKLARLTEMLEEVAAVRERALVFTQFAVMGAILKRHLEESFGRETPFLHGGLPKKDRDLLVERFQSDGEGPFVFVLSLKAGGTGLNLTRANHVFHFDRWWNPAVENQATDRAFRIGQMKNVQVHKLITSGTLEEKIDELIENKKGIAERVIGAGEGWLTKLSNDELKKIIALRGEPVGDKNGALV